MKVLVLNHDYTFLNVIDHRKALRFVESGKVVIEKVSQDVMRTVDGWMPIPLVVRFVNFIRRKFKKGVRWAKPRVIIRDNRTCMYCGETKGKMTVDHITPVSKGGRNKWENTVCSCGPCNHRKADRTPREANMHLRTKPVQPTVTEYLMKRLFNEEARLMMKEFLADFGN